MAKSPVLQLESKGKVVDAEAHYCIDTSRRAANLSGSGGVVGKRNLVHSATDVKVLIVKWKNSE